MNHDATTGRGGAAAWISASMMPMLPHMSHHIQPYDKPYNADLKEKVAAECRAAEERHKEKAATKKWNGGTCKSVYVKNQ